MNSVSKAGEVRGKHFGDTLLLVSFQFLPILLVFSSLCVSSVCVSILFPRNVSIFFSLYVPIPLALLFPTCVHSVSLLLPLRVSVCASLPVQRSLCGVTQLWPAC